MKIELKSLKHCEFASEETLCFEATIYVDNKKVGYVSNDGKGGCNHIRYGKVSEKDNSSTRKAVNEFLKTLPSTKSDILPDREFDFDEDFFYSALVENYLTVRDWKRRLSKKIYVRKKDFSYAEGEWHTLNTKYDAKFIAWLNKGNNREVYPTIMHKDNMMEHIEFPYPEIVHVMTGKEAPALASA